MTVERRSETSLRGRALGIALVCAAAGVTCAALGFVTLAPGGQSGGKVAAILLASVAIAGAAAWALTRALFRAPLELASERVTPGAVPVAEPMDRDFSRKELASLTFSVSHDLRAPLRVVDGFSEALLEDYRDRLDEIGLEYLERIRGATARMQQLLDGLLELSRATQADLRRETVSLTAMADSIASGLRESEPEREVEFAIERGLSVEGDPDLLRQALLHLMANSWKFTRRKPRARIELGREQGDGAPIFYVRDDGAGFDPGYADKLFGAFQRLHTESEFEGMGIGLAVVRRIIERHGGRVWAEGKPDEGATVRIRMQ